MDWEHPGTTTWSAPSFYQFSTNTLTSDCTYDNNNADDPNHLKTITSGQSAVTNEMCMATGYFFPATGASICYCTGPTSCYSL
jgi:hypothetical protein